MAGRTFAIGDIHGDYAALRALLSKLPKPDAEDTIVFVGDYIDRGPDSARVVDYIMSELPKLTEAKIVALRGNHEDSWLRVIDGEWQDFVLPPGNGCLQCMESFLGREISPPGTFPPVDELDLLASGSFFPDEVVQWMRGLPYWYEDDHAIYVHAGLPEVDGEFLHPSEATEGKQRTALLWLRSKSFFADYRGKRVVVGHTSTGDLPPELSVFTPDDPIDLWAGPSVVGLDTRAGKGGFLTAVQFPERLVYESREHSPEG